MLHRLTDHFSIWEIAHRWHDYDPNLSHKDTIPLEVQDTIRLLTHSAFWHVMGITVRGTDLKWERQVPSYAEFLENQDQYMYRLEGVYSERLERKVVVTELHENELHDCWCDLREQIIRRHEAEVESFPEIFRNRKYNVDVLEHVHLSRENVIRFCLYHKLDLPGFMFPSEVSLSSVEDPESHYDSDVRSLFELIKKDREDQRSSRIPDVEGFPTEQWAFLNEIAQRAFKEWWSTYDPEDRNTAPNRDEVIKWLVDTFKISKESASTIQTAIRAPETSKGGTKSR